MVAPPPAPLPAKAISFSPPERAALHTAWSAAAPLPPEAAPPPAKAAALPATGSPSASKGPPAVAGEAHFAALQADPEEPVMLPSATLAAEINRFVDDLQETWSYTGVVAFMVFALLKQLRVFVWYGSQREDIIARYAPWASTQILAAAPFEAIACRLTVSDAGVVSHHIVEDPREVNHWVACVDQGGRHGDGASRHGDGAEADDEETLTFQAVYLSFDRIVTWTVCDGDCGLDVLCLMGGLSRCRLQRDSLRTELSAFVVKHAGNRALISILFQLVEVTEHLGMFELAAAGAELVVDDAHHGDGEAPRPIRARDFTEEEMCAVIWKCKLNKASPEYLQILMRALPEWCIQSAVQDYKAREPEPTPVKSKPPFLTSRDTLLSKRLLAGQHFTEWCTAHFPPSTTIGGHQGLLKMGVPRGWFRAYAKAHWKELQLNHGCKGKHAPRYKRIYKLYQQAAQLYATNGSRVVEEAVVEDDVVVPSAVAEKTGNEKYRYHTARKGAMYSKNILPFQRDYKRRRIAGKGGGQRIRQ